LVILHFPLNRPLRSSSSAGRKEAKWEWIRSSIFSPFQLSLSVHYAIDCF
jgi:hypothetical protein